jgi:DNA-binding transcriptional LysR family regulator
LFVEMKQGVAIVPRMCVEREVASGDLRGLRIRQMRVMRKLYLVYRRDRPLSAAAQEMLEVIRQKPRGAGARRSSKNS